MKLSLYCDGGTVGRNPSPHGGPWAWCYIDEDNVTVLNKDSGVLTPHNSDIGKSQLCLDSRVTNNHTEFYAMLMGLENLPSQWEGRVCSDSLITLARFFVLPWRGYTTRWPLKNIPLRWIYRMEDVRKRLSLNIEPVLLNGHPSRNELESGIGHRGLPTSIHNKWCDDECTRLAIKFAKENNVYDSRAKDKVQSKKVKIRQKSATLSS